jgi:hypothetical protein
MKITQILLLLIPLMLFGGGTFGDHHPLRAEEGCLKVAQDQATAMTLYDSADRTKANAALSLTAGSLDKPNMSEIQPFFHDLKGRFPDLYQVILAYTVIMEPGGNKAMMKVAVKSALHRGPTPASVYRANIYVYEDELVKTQHGWKSLRQPTPVEYFWLDETTESAVVKHLVEEDGLDLVE